MHYLLELFNIFESSLYPHHQPALSPIMYLNQKLWSLTEGLRHRIALSVGMGLGGSILGMLRLLVMGLHLPYNFNSL